MEGCVQAINRKYRRLGEAGEQICIWYPYKRLWSHRACPPCGRQLQSPPIRYNLWSILYRPLLHGSPCSYFWSSGSAPDWCSFHSLTGWDLPLQSVLWHQKLESLPAAAGESDMLDHFGRKHRSRLSIYLWGKSAGMWPQDIRKDTAPVPWQGGESWCVEQPKNRDWLNSEREVYEKNIVF